MRCEGLYESGRQAERPEFLPAEGGYLLHGWRLSRRRDADVLIDAYNDSHLPAVMLGTPHPTSPGPESLPAGVTMRTSVAHQNVIAATVRAACGGQAPVMGQAGRLQGRRFTAAHAIPLFEEALQTTTQTAC